VLGWRGELKALVDSSAALPCVVAGRFGVQGWSKGAAWKESRQLSHPHHLRFAKTTVRASRDPPRLAEELE
jgi:hypothetical protein